MYEGEKATANAGLSGVDDERLCADGALGGQGNNVLEGISVIRKNAMNAKDELRC